MAILYLVIILGNKYHWISLSKYTLFFIFNSIDCFSLSFFQSYIFPFLPSSTTLTNIRPHLKFVNSALMPWLEDYNKFCTWNLQSPSHHVPSYPMTKNVYFLYSKFSYIILREGEKQRQYECMCHVCIWSENMVLQKAIPSHITHI